MLYFFRLLIISSIAILFIGLFKPEWLRYRGKQPDLLMTFAMAFGLFMAGFTGASKTYYTPDANITEAAKAGVNISKAVYTNDMSATGCQPESKPGEAGSISKP
jgi:polyhydroxybutyrate depolymerase